MMRRGFAFLGRNAPSLLASGLAIGLAWPRAASVLRPAIAPLVFLLTVATMLRVDWPAVLRHARRPGRIALIALWCLVGSPLVVAGLVRVLPMPQGLAEALVFWAAASPLVSAPALAMLMGLDGALALVAVMTATLLVPLTLPPLLLWLLGLQLKIGAGELTLRLALFVAGAVLAAAALRRLLGTARLERLAEEINGFNVLILVLFGVGAMDGVRLILAERPGDALLFLLATYAATIGFILLSTLAFAWLGLRAALTVGVVGGNKNMAMAWANLGAAAPADFGLFFVAAQLPIYTLPLILRPFCRRLFAGTLPPLPGNPALTVAEPKQ